MLLSDLNTTASYLDNAVWFEGKVKSGELNGNVLVLIHVMVRRRLRWLEKAVRQAKAQLEPGS
jgi:hypothetical protein